MNTATIKVQAKTLKHGFSALGLRSDSRFLSRSENFAVLAKKIMERFGLELVA